MSLKPFQAFQFVISRTKNTNPDSPPHYHITVPINDDSSLLLTVITSQTEARQNFCRRTRKEALSSLVTVSKKDLKFLKKTSIVECNQPQLVRKIDFNKIVDPDNDFARDIPEELKVGIIKAIKDSPIVKPFIKKMVQWL